MRYSWNFQRLGIELFSYPTLICAIVISTTLLKANLLVAKYDTIGKLTRMLAIVKPARKQSLE